MGTISVHEFMSLDGVFEDPRWTFEFGFDPAMGETLGAVTGEATGILLGRTTFEAFAPAWRDRTAEQDPGAPFFNESPKHVVSSTLTSEDADASWRNSSVVGPYDPARIRTLKDDTDGALYVSGSGRLVRAMLADGLVDDLHLFVYPVALGSGLRLFAEGSPQTKLTLKGATTYANGVQHLHYGPA